MQEVLIDEISDEMVVSDEYIATFFHQEKLEVTFLFRSFFSNTKLLRELIIRILQHAQAPLLWQNRFMLIVDELNNNAIEYGSLEWDLNKMSVILQKRDWNLEISIEVQDSWKWALAKTAQDMLEIKEKRVQKWFENHQSIRGRWLFLIIIKLVDHLYFKDAPDGGLIVGVHKKLPLE